MNNENSPQNKADPILVFDVGCRFGLHPSWAPLKHSPVLKTYAFDPDSDEIVRLKKKYLPFKNYEAVCLGFSDRAETRTLNILSHKGQSSLLRPNTNSLWFGDARKGEDHITETREIKLETLDSYVAANKVSPDFLKTDTEGFDLAVLKGGIKTLHNVMAVRCEVYFEEVFVGCPQFDEIYSFLLSQSFGLANLDYAGKGIPQSYFCPNVNRFGILGSSEAVFIRKESFILSLPIPQIVKFSIFCLLNNLEDLAHKILLSKRQELKSVDAALMHEAKKLYLHAAKKLLYIPGDSYERAQKDFTLIFGEAYPDKHQFFESDLLNPP